MGALWSVLRDLFAGEKRAKIVVVGLAAAGKTTVLYKLKLGEAAPREHPPTLGSNVERVSRGNLSMEVWDLAGQESLRDMWSVYFSSVNGIALVVDSANRDEAEVGKVRVELEKMLSSEDLRGVPLLVLANKQDLPGAMAPAELTRALALDAIHDRPWHMRSTVATRGDGLEDGFAWLANQVLAQLASSSSS